MKNTLFIAILVFSFISVFGQKQLTPVEAGSKVHFNIKNFGIGTGGDLQGLKGTIVINPTNPSASSANVTVDVSTIDTDNSRRDSHLKNADYFEVTKYPIIRIVSSSIGFDSKTGNYIFNGKLTIKDVTENITFPFVAVPNGGGYLLTGSFSINRLKFHVGGESTTLGDNIDVTLKVVAR